MFLSPAFKADMDNASADGDTTLSDLKDAFKKYWSSGFHPSFGQDAHFAKPKEILSLSVRKSHVDNGVYRNDKGYTSTEGAWVKWRSGKEYIKPASDAYLIYAVTDQRNAMLNAFLDEDAHNTVENMAYMDEIIEVTYKFYHQTNSKPMPIDEHDALFDDKWLED